MMTTRLDGLRGARVWGLAAVPLLGYGLAPLGGEIDPTRAFSMFALWLLVVPMAVGALRGRRPAAA